MKYEMQILRFLLSFAVQITDVMIPNDSTIVFDDSLICLSCALWVHHTNSVPIDSL